MSTFKQSFAWWCFGGAFKQNAPVLLRAAAQIGYQGVEMIPEELWPAVREAGLTVATMGGHKSIEDGLNNPANHARIEAEICGNLETARRNGVSALICFSGSRKGLDDERGVAHTIAGLRRVKQRAEDAGVTLLLELLNSKVDHKDYQCDHTPWGAAVVKGVDSPRVKLLYDIYHMQIMEGDVIRTIRENSGFIGHYHTAGVPGRRDLDAEQELCYPAIAAAIRATGFTGFVGQEFKPKGDPIEALKCAFEQCQR